MDKRYNRYKCGTCGEHSTAKDWNEETSFWHDICMHQIDTEGKEFDSFVCPKCGEEQPRLAVLEVNPNE